MTMSEGENSSMLEETNSYIQKMEAVEQARKSSGESTAEVVVEAEVNVVVQEYQDPIGDYELVVEAGEILEGAAAIEEEEEVEEEIIIPGSTQLTVEAGEIISESAEVEAGELVANSLASESMVTQVGEEEEQEQEEEKQEEEEEASLFKTKDYEYSVSETANGAQETEEDKVEYEYSAVEDAASSSFTASKSMEDYYRDNGYPDEEEEVNAKEEFSRRPAAGFPGEDEDVLEYNREKSHAPVVDQIKALQIDRKEEDIPVPAPRAAERTTEVLEAPKPAQRTEVKMASASSSPKVVVESRPVSSQEEMDFENRVRQSVSQFKTGEKKKTNVQVLNEIAAEEGEDRPDVKKLLAWAKSTKKTKTETMVVRQKKHEDNIKRAVDFGGVNIVLSEKNKETKKPEPVPVAKAKTTYGAATQPSIQKSTSKVFKVQVETESEAVVERVASYLGVKNPTNIKIEKIRKGVSLMTFDGSGSGFYRWTFIDNEVEPSKEIYILRDLSKNIVSFLGSSRKTEDLLPFNNIVYSDKKWTVFAENQLYKSPNPNKPLDEAHLKIGMKALARLHAATFVYFKRKDDATATKLLTNKAYLEQSRIETKKALEMKLERIIKAMQGSVDIERVKSLKNMLVNIYKEAESSQSLLPVLCQGMPTLANIQFVYASDGQPCDARFKNLESCVLGSGLTDLHLFINTSGDNNAREDFLLRFVYYETLVNLLKSFGEKVEFSYEDLKKEFVKKRLYGYIQSSAILAEKVVSNTAAVKTSSSQSAPKEVQSKILGKFTPKTKMMAVSAFAGGSMTSSAATAADKIDPATKIKEMINKAIKL